MKKTIIILLAALSAVSFTSCNTTKSTKAYEVLDIVDKNGIPSWFYEVPSSNEYHYAVGLSTSSNSQIAIKKAEMDAKNQITQWIKTSVKEVVKNYVNESGEGNNSQNLDAYESISLQIASASLRGVKRDKLQISKDNTAYVLMSIPLENIQNAFIQVTNNDDTLDSYKIQSAFDSLLNNDL
ncbi:MAG: LPP20 family lipoprotein [Spirochaetaceae bacterium]|nr:LPP20 family lipoprotein [Spirochaetaceae bacterium]